MKKIFILLPFIILFSCNPENGNDDTNNTNNLSIVLTPSVTTAVVGQQFTLMVTSNEQMSLIEKSTDNFVTSSGIGGSGGLGLSKELYFNFDTLGDKTISIRVQNDNGDEKTENVVVSITRGTAIKINKLQVISFSNINNTWDPEYSGTDPNRLADVYFGISKSKLHTFYEPDHAHLVWYISPVKENQGDLTWDLSADNLYINPVESFTFGLVDKDGGLAQDLMLGPPYEKTVSFSSYLVSKPTTITYSYPEINLEFILTVDWP